MTYFGPLCFPCDPGEICCDGTCCQPGEECCDDKSCYDPATEQCCGQGTGHTCPKDETCCGSNCCDPAQCKQCVDDVCVDRCDPDLCQECDGEGFCEVCNGEPDKVCCDDGSCVEPCEEVGNETMCSSDKSVNCPACVGLLGDCSDYKAKFYSNEIIYNCSGGCPGDCDDELFDPPCYEEHFCKDYIHYDFAECRGYIPPEPPGPLDCRDAGQPWGCTRCQQGAYYRTLHVLSRRCK
jgi:hypothetical protein